MHRRERQDKNWMLGWYTYTYVYTELTQNSTLKVKWGGAKLGMRNGRKEMELRVERSYVNYISWVY